MVKIVGIALLAVGIASPALAQDRERQPRAPQFQSLMACRQIADQGARLACFDAQAAAIDAAEARSDIVVVDRQQLRSTRRSLFGLALPRIPFLDDDRTELPKEYEATIRSVSVTRDGKLTFDLGDATWRTTEVSTYQSEPRAGEKVKIRRGPLGSFKLSVEGRPAMRALRVR